MLVDGKPEERSHLHCNHRIYEWELYLQDIEDLKAVSDHIFYRWWLQADLYEINVELIFSISIRFKWYGINQDLESVSGANKKIPQIIINWWLWK